MYTVELLKYDGNYIILYKVPNQSVKFMLNWYLNQDEDMPAYARNATGNKEKQFTIEAGSIKEIKISE